MKCQNCGSNDVVEKEIEGYLVSECEICEHLHGNRESVEKILEIREARAESIDPIIYPLYKAMRKADGIKIQYACPGYPHEKTPPYVSFEVLDNLGHLSRLTEAVLAAQNQTNYLWAIEAGFQKKLNFSLKPRYHSDPYNLSAEQISVSQKDLPILAEKIAESLSAS